MANDSHNAFAWITLLLFGFLLGGLFVFLICRAVSLSNGEGAAQTTVRIDTIALSNVSPDTIYRTKYVVRKFVKFDTITRELRDTIKSFDSVEVAIPISEYKYHKDSVYDLTIEGYGVMLKQATFYPQTITRTIKIPKSGFHFSTGVQVGVGMTPKGVQPYTGVGIGFGWTF